MYVHTNVRGANVSAEAEAILFQCMRHEGERADSMIRSFSGADQADSEIHRIARRFYVQIWEGRTFAEASADCERQWREYAAAQKAKVDAAPKIKRGPSRGHSSISHRWVDPDRWASGTNIANLAFWVRKAGIEVNTGA